MIRARLEFKLHDMWIGAYWRRSRCGRFTDVWLCLVPCLPIHIMHAKPAPLDDDLCFDFEDDAIPEWLDQEATHRSTLRTTSASTTSNIDGNFGGLKDCPKKCMHAARKKGKDYERNRCC